MFRPAGHVGILADLLYDNLKKLLTKPTDTGFDTHDLRRLGSECSLKAAIGRGGEDCAVTVDAIAAGLPAGMQIRPLDDLAWQAAMDLGRALVVLGVYRSPDPRVSAIAAAGTRLTQHGYNLKIRGGHYVFGGGELERATARVLSLLSEIGQINVFGKLFRILRETGRYGCDMYLPVRDYKHQRKDPSIPYGFLVNLAAKLPALGTGAQDISAS